MVSHSSNGGVGVNSRSKNGSNHSHIKPNVDSSDSIVLRLVGTASILFLGFLNWLLFLFLAIKSGTFFGKQSEQEKNQFAIAQDTLWNLSKQPVPGFAHRFFKTRTGFQFHYITNQEAPATDKDLIIFLHGFPNTCMTWRYIFQESALPTTTATLIAVDLPGHGGSDSMMRYDTQVLEYLTEFIVVMREKYGTSGDSVGSTFIVGHDWGCVIAMRLAAEAPSLADRFILSNGPSVDLVKANVERALNSSRSIFKQFRTSPRKNFGCLYKSYQAIQPLLRQVAYSGYIFAFQLPYMFVKPLGSGGNLSFLKACYKAEHSESRDEYKVYESMAANLGPSIGVCKTELKGGEQYSPSVAQRAKSTGEVFWHSTAYYRDGLGADPWEKSIETIAALYNLDSDLSSSDSPARRRSSSASSALFTDHTKGGMRAPVTILWGEDDVALTKPICIDGIGDFLAKESEVFMFPKFGHWLQTGKESRKVMAQIINLFANGNSKQSPSYIAPNVKKIDATATLMARR